jgi:hypothetical protein
MRAVGESNGMGLSYFQNIGPKSDREGPESVPKSVQKAISNTYCDFSV